MRLVDGFGRVHTDLRVSLTDRCSLRCTYCMPEHMTWLGAETLLTAAEIERLVGVATTLGITRVRLTGGEPLMRKDLVDIVRGVSSLPDPPDLAMTTNGIGLDRLARPLAEAGLRRINVSLDTTDPATFHRITRRDRLADVLAGLDAAAEAGLDPVKINAVLQRGVNDREATHLLEFAVSRGFELRFIEQMPLDGERAWKREAMVSAEEIIAEVGRTHRLTEVAGRGHAPAARWLVDSGPAIVGIIAAVTEPFCAACDRLRLTADGYLRNCLFSLEEQDLRTPLRAGATDDDLAEVFIECVSQKRAGHEIGRSEFRQPIRPMSAIGG